MYNISHPYANAFAPVLSPLTIRKPHNLSLANTSLIMNIADIRCRTTAKPEEYRIWKQCNKVCVNIYVIKTIIMSINQYSINDQAFSNFVLDKKVLLLLTHWMVCGIVLNLDYIVEVPVNDPMRTIRFEIN